MRTYAALALMILLPANRAPQSQGVDSHIQHVLYNPDDVVRLTGAIGWQITLEFGADERIENVSIGDSLAWQVTPNKRAKMLFLKPLTAKASTNMTVITSQRQYAFALGTGPRSLSTPWIVRFDYPRAVVETVPEPPAPPQPRLNFAYAKAGDAQLLPTRVWDDGRQTYFEFAPEVSLPAIFAGGPGKDEALVNVVNQGRVAVVQQTSGRFTLRAGKRFATVTYAPLEAAK